MAFPVMLDACVLIPVQLASVLLRLAEVDQYRPLWSHEILAETERNLARMPNMTSETARRRVDAMRGAFPDAMVTGYESLTDSMTNHVKDRHVLAAAVRGSASIIVTANLKDFKPPALEPYNIDAVHPDDFLLDQREMHPQSTFACLAQELTSLHNPAYSCSEFLANLQLTAPKFAQELRDMRFCDYYESFGRRRVGPA